MRAWVVSELTQSGAMALREVADPSVAADECVVRVEAAGVNFLDTLMMRGLYQVKPPLPFTPGVEIVGVVVERGPDSPYAVGDRLCALIDHGGFAEFARIPRLASLRVPSAMPARDAVSLPSVYPTAYLALRDRAGLKAGETVLVHAGAGGIGSASIQLAKHWGATVIATAGGPDKVALCHDLGADAAIDYRAGSFVGVGCDPLDPEQLRFVYEQNLAALPTMAVTLAYPGYWYRDLDTGLDHQRTVHASESIAIHSTLPVEGTVVARPRVIEVVDKGRERGALVISEREIIDAATGERLATVRQTAMCRGDGGFSHAPQKGERPTPFPDRAPDRALTLPTPLQAALIYRLSGDPNPLHVDPEFARAAGFPRPVLHGLATMGLICHAAVRLVLDGAPERLRTMDCRFTAARLSRRLNRLRFLAYRIRVDFPRFGLRPHGRAGEPL